MERKGIFFLTLLSICVNVFPYLKPYICEFFWYELLAGKFSFHIFLIYLYNKWNDGILLIILRFMSVISFVYIFSRSEVHFLAALVNKLVYDVLLLARLCILLRLCAMKVFICNWVIIVCILFYFYTKVDELNKSFRPVVVWCARN